MKRRSKTGAPILGILETVAEFVQLPWLLHLCLGYGRQKPKCQHEGETNYIFHQFIPRGSNLSRTILVADMEHGRQDFSACAERWPGLSKQRFGFDKWSICGLVSLSAIAGASH